MVASASKVMTTDIQSARFLAASPSAADFWPKSSLNFMCATSASFSFPATAAAFFRSAIASSFLF